MANNDDGANLFRMHVHNALEYCHQRTTVPLAPTRYDTHLHWLVDWGNIIRIIHWEDLFVDHDRMLQNKTREAESGEMCSDADATAISATSATSATTALVEVCAAIQTIVWAEHLDRLKHLRKFFNVGRGIIPNSPKEGAENDDGIIIEKQQPLQQYWLNTINQFHDAQLRTLQKLFLDVWVDCAALGQCYYDDTVGILVVPSKRWNEHNGYQKLTPSERFMLAFVLEQLTKPFLAEQSTSSNLGDGAKKTAVFGNWDTIMHQYTHCLCNDIQSLIHPSDLNPIAAILSPEPEQYVDGHDVQIRINILFRLVPKIRKWTELLAGLLHDELNNVLIDDVRQATTITTTLCINTLYEQLKDANAFSLLTPAQQQMVAASSAKALDSIRLLDISLQAKHSEIKRAKGKGKEARAIKSRLNDEQRNQPPEEIHQVMMMPSCINESCKKPTKRKTTPTHKTSSSVSSPSTTTALCIIKACQRIGQIANSGLCEHHTKKMNVPNPFHWENEITVDMGVRTMKRLKRHELSVKDNIHAAFMKEAIRVKMKARQGRK